MILAVSRYTRYMKKFNHKYTVTEWVLIGIILWGIVLRIYKFGAIPAGLNRDEAALGYNAFAVANFGEDEWNRRYPIIFESFGDYKLPGYIYTLAPIIKIFGVYDRIIRLPSLLAGIGLIGLGFQITQHMTKNRTISLLAAALLAVSPWAIFYSRTAYEANVSLMWLGLTVYFIIIQKKIWQVVTIGLTYALAVSSYNAPLLLLPILWIFIASLPSRSWLNKLGLCLPLALVGLVSLWLLMPLTAQKKNITIFSDPTIISQIAQDYSLAASGVGKLWESKYVTWGVMIVEKAAGTMGATFLVQRGGAHPWHSIPGYGHINWVTFGLFWVGMVLILLRKLPWQRMGISLLILTLGAILPAAVTVDAPHATRSLLFLYLIPLIASFGWYTLKKAGWLIIGLVVLESAVYTNAYFRVYGQLEQPSYPVGFEEITMKVDKLLQNNSTLTITQAQNSEIDLMSEQLYIWFLLYGKVNPEEFARTQEMAGRDAAGLVRVKKFGNYVIVNDRDKIGEQEYFIERQPNNHYLLVNQ